MKINFGKYKGQKISSPKNEKMRPTTGMAKSIIFNSISIDFNDEILDVFAGTGALGFESISLGAKHVTFIDENYESIKSIYETISKLNLSENEFQVYKGDFRNILKKIQTYSFDYIFLDPPFSVKKFFSIPLEMIYKFDLLKPGGTIILEVPFKMEINELKFFKVTKLKKLGEKNILFLEKHE